jgi:hypothetical protein
MLIKEYEQQATVKELVQRFGIHRLTVTSLLRRHGVELRRVGLAQADIQTAASLYDQSWSLARHGERSRLIPPPFGERYELPGC